MPMSWLPIMTFSMTMAAALASAGCGDDGGNQADAAPVPDAAIQPTAATAWYFIADPESNVWTVTIVDPTAPETALSSFSVDDLAVLSGPAGAGGNDQGPAWGDATASTNDGRIFVNAQSVNRVAVFDTHDRSLEAVLDVGERPVHLWNPNHGSEIWTHSDGLGAFYVIDQTSLAVSDPVVAALNDTGHGKLLYAEELGNKYYATNTNDPGGFPIDGASRTAGDIITLCAQPCADDPITPEDESQLACGGTHDKVYNPTLNYAIFECSGAARGTFAFLDAETDIVVQDLVPMSGGIAHSDGNEYIFVIDETAEADQIKIWITSADGHDGISFDHMVTVGGQPSARGTVFHHNSDGAWDAWIPQTAGTKVAVLNLSTLEIEEIEIGILTPPEGAGHASRRSVIGGQWFFTYSDAGIVIIDLETRAVTRGPATQGQVSRVVFVDPASHQ